MSGVTLATKGKVVGMTSAADWSTVEKDQIRDALGVDGAKTKSTGGVLQKIKSGIDTVIAFLS